MRIRNEARRLAENRNWMLGTAQVASVVIFPIIEAILLKNQASLGGLFVALGVPILVLHAIFGVFVFLATRTESFYFEFEDAQAEIAEREDAVQQLRQQLDEEREQRDDLDWTHETNDLALQYLHLLISNSDLHDGDSLKDAVGVVLDPFIHNREQVFGFKNNARYNISVYLYDPDLQHLAPYYRFVDDRISRSDRCWKPGNGHIGICFSQNRGIVSSDVSESPLLSDSMTETDMSNYQSMASIPIQSSYPSQEKSASSNLKTTEPRGVFIVTSSEVDQLTAEAHEVTLGIIARLLSILFDHADLLNDRH